MNANTIELIKQIERRTVLVYDLETMAQLTNRNVTEVYINDSATFVEKDAPIEAIYILVEGEMQVINIFENGSMYKFASIKPYAFIGAFELLSGNQQYAATLITRCKCNLIKLEKEDFLRLIESDHTIALDVLTFISKAMFDQSYTSGEIKILPAHLMLTKYLIKQYETENRPVLILRQKRLEVAEHLGLSERTINRTILKLKQEGLINVTSGKVKISRENFDRLKKYLDLKGCDVS